MRKTAERLARAAHRENARFLGHWWISIRKQLLLELLRY